MAGDNMEVDAAEAKLKTMEHSEQHYFKRFVTLARRSVYCYRQGKRGHLC